MDDHDILASLDPTGRLRELFKARKWSDASSFCDRRVKRGDSPDALQVCSYAPLKRIHFMSLKLMDKDLQNNRSLA